MSELVGESSGCGSSELWASLEVICCKIYGKIDAIKRCGRYKVVGYCGKEH